MAQSLRIVLIEPEFSGNLGSVARAMGNMGFEDLVLVSPTADIDDRDARMMAVATYPILRKARIVDTLVNAIGDCHWVAGFTRRAGRHRREFLPITELAETTHRHFVSDHNVAFVFGPEKRGFTTEEAATCQHLVQIPTSEEHASLNLAAAVMVALYELNRAHIEVETPYPHKEASIDEIEGMYAHLDELYEAVHYFDEQNRQRIPQILRRLLNRARPTPQEVRIIRGLCRNALNAIKDKS
jgi:TrmH family RNA methyltransferase